ncbi:sensor histidine kinase [Streptococcus halichoeri]|uniref:sensor histidine kinase n=1 Tax=Streptococcus halichoeri TaxID=254785 RepID=UPI001359CEF0|nr:sensor histidine kinase [Streptococcus halichoeri]
MKGDQVEEQFKRHLQEDISRHFSKQSFIVSLILIFFFIIFSFAPQEIGLYQDFQTVKRNFQTSIRHHYGLLNHVSQSLVPKYLRGQLSSSELNQLYYQLRQNEQTQAELVVYNQQQSLVFASNPHLGNVFNQSVHLREILQHLQPDTQKRVLKVTMENDNSHFLLFIKPIVIGHRAQGYTLLVLNGTTFLTPVQVLNSNVIIADKWDNSLVFTSREFVESSLDKVRSTALQHPIVFRNHQAYTVRSQALTDELTLWLYRPLFPLKMILLFSLLSSLTIFIILRKKSAILANQIAVANSQTISQMVTDMQAISKQKKTRIQLHSHDEFQYLANQINQMVSRLQSLHNQTLVLEKEKFQFERRMLEAQFNPHFLYNTLETILITSQCDPVLTETIVLQLTKILRYSVDQTSQLVTLEDDLVIIESFLAINAIRFAELRYTIDLDPNLKHIKVPKLFLLPLVENAIKYGFKQRHDVAIRITCQVDGDQFLFKVSDNGQGISPAKQEVILNQLNSQASQHGLSNTYRRLKHAYQRVTLDFEQADQYFSVIFHVKE